MDDCAGSDSKGRHDSPCKDNGREQDLWKDGNTSRLKIVQLQRLSLRQYDGLFSDIMVLLSRFAMGVYLDLDSSSAADKTRPSKPVKPG